MDITTKPASTTNYKTGGWRTYITKVDIDKCIGCGICAKVCPENCIKMVKIKGETKQSTDYDYCKGCGICAAECPVKAIEMELEKK